MIVGLYPADEFNDSLVFKQKPYYVATVNEETDNFQLKYLRKGKYKLSV